MKVPQLATLTLDKIVGGGQALGTLDDGRKAFVWGGLPGEKVAIRITKKKSSFVEGVVTEVLTKSPERIEPLDPESYLSTSPWQIMRFEVEQHYKAALIEEAFELHDIVLPDPIEVYTDDKQFHYRNKVEFSWFGHEKSVLGSKFLVLSENASTSSADESSSSSEALTRSLGRSPETRADDERAANRRHGENEETLDLAFFRRGSKGKIIVDECSLLPEPMMHLARAIRDLLRAKQVSARQLKTLLIRCDQRGNCVWQLYVKDQDFSHITPEDVASLSAQGGEVIYSDPRSPASRITKRLASFSNTVLTDTILGIPFSYATEGFFQVNIPVYEQALKDMQEYVTGYDWGLESSESQRTESTSASRTLQGEGQASEFISEGKRRGAPLLDLYSGVGSIGLTIGGDNCTLIEIDENAVREMKRNIKEQGSNAKPVLAPSEKALEYITGNEIVIVDPPRAGMHKDVIDRLLEVTPPRIIYLSCNPVTQARDVALLSEKYGIRAHKGYDFFPRTPHIEHLVILDRK